MYIISKRETKEKKDERQVLRMGPVEMDDEWRVIQATYINRSSKGALSKELIWNWQQ